MRKATPPAARAKSLDKQLPAPVKGWISATNLANPQPSSATVLENWFPQRRSIRLRGGALRKATISVTLAVESVFSYDAGTIRVLFAATSGAVYDITTPVDPVTIPAAEFSGQTSGYYSTALFSTAGGTFLTIVNGTDARRYYDGAAWATAPALTGATGDTNGNTLSHVWVYRNRMFFVQKNTLNAWYLPVDSISGALSQVSLAGVFQRGGSLLTGTSWSIESGDGLNDRCVFISTNGEVAVFQGTDPSAPATWSIVGRYDIGVMLGKNAFLRVAGDVLLMTADGMIPLSMAVSRDRAALSLNAVSAPIEPDWKADAVARTDNWTVVKWPEKNMMIVALPTQTGYGEYCYVANLETGAWAKYTGWDTNCVCIFEQGAYFGTSSGTIMEAETGANDDDLNYTCIYVGQYENWGNEAVHKIAHLMRSTFIASVPFTPKISVVTNFKTTLPSPPSAAVDPDLDVWDTALWDVGIWDSSGAQSIVTRWRSVSGQGFSMAPVVQVTCGGTTTPDAQLVVNQVKFILGEIVV